LHNAIKQSPNPDVRQAAHEELDRRSKEEALQEQNGDPKNKEGKEKFIDLRIKLNDEFSKISQELADFTDYSNNEALKEIQGRQRIVSKFIQFFSRLGKDSDLNKNTDIIKNRLNFDGDIKDLFGDGEVLHLDIKSDENKLSCTVVFEDGITNRIFDTKNNSVQMQYFYLNPLKEKGKGLGTNIFKNQVEQFKKLGFRKLVTEAGKGNGLNGYYTWARLGYKFESKLEEGLLSFMLKKESDKKIKKIKSLQELMSTKEGRNWWREYGFAFNGTFDLSDDSISMKTLNEYRR